MLKKSIFEEVKSFIGVRIKQKSVTSLKSQVPGRLSEITSIETNETDSGFDIKVKVGSPLAEMLDSGEVYNSGFTQPSLAKIKSWASYKGLADMAVPIWISLKKNDIKKKYTNWKENLYDKVKDLLR